VRHLHESTGEVVLAVDADPNANLGYKLGTEPARTVGNLREEMISRGEEPPPGMSKQEYIDYQIRLALKEGNGFDLLTMGRQEGPGCYCYINNMLRTFVDALSDRYRYVVIDNEAGLEHLSRRTTRASDVMFVLCDRSRAAFVAAKRISSLAEEMKLKIGRKILVFNMLDPDSADPPEPEVSGFDRVYGLRRSGTIQTRMEKDESLVDLPKRDPTYADVAKMIDAERRGP
jgi:CO dehydrogenase maturation factor